MAGTCDCGNEPSSSIKCVEFLVIIIVFINNNIIIKIFINFIID